MATEKLTGSPDVSGGELGVLVGGSTHEAVMAAEVRELHFETVVVNVDANALFGNLFEEFDRTACTEAYAALASCVLDGEACRESVLLVAAGDCQLIAAESDEEIIEDSEAFLEFMTLLTAEVAL